MADDVTASEDIVLETANPHDLAAEDLLDLRQRLTSRLGDIKIGVSSDEQHGAGGPWYQVLHVWIGFTILKTLGYDLLIDICKDWLREQFSTLHGKKRPKTLIVYDMATGKEIMSTSLKDEQSDFVIEIQNPTPRKMPRGRHQK